MPAHFRFSCAGLLLVLLGVSCAPALATSAPTEAVFPSPPTPTLITIPTETSTATLVLQAPFCVWNQTPTPVAGLCSGPAGNLRDQFCVGQQPFALLALSPGDTYQVQTPGITCQDAGIKNDYHLLTCTGPRATGFNLQVCNPSCVAAPATATAVVAGQCPSGYEYLAAESCCQQAASDQRGCIILNFGTPSCGQVDCSQYGGSSSCNAHKTCKWVTPAKASAQPYCAPR